MSCSEYSKESFRVVVYCSIIKVLCVVVVLATAHLYYHRLYRFVNNFFHFFIFPFVISAHGQVAVLTTNVMISRHLGIVNNVFVFYLFQTIHTIYISVQPCASNRKKNNWELAHIVVLFLFEAYGALPKREVAVAQRIRAVWLNCNKFTPFHNVPKCRILPRCCLWEGTRIRTGTIPFFFSVCFHSFCP